MLAGSARTLGRSAAFGLALTHIVCDGGQSLCQASGASGAPDAQEATGPQGAALPVKSPAPRADVTLTAVPGATTKLQQLLGEEDKERHQPTSSRTFTRYGIRGTDLGFSFEHDGRVYFLFGDTVGRLDRGLDTIATTDARDPEAGVRLDFLTDGDKYLTIQPPGISMAGFEVPVSGIDLGGKVYVIVRTNHLRGDWTTDRTVLTRFTPPADFRPLRHISERFQTMSIRAQPVGEPMPGLPPGGHFVLAWATARYRKSDVYLFLIPVSHFEDGEGTLYFAGLNTAGEPLWSTKESDAAAVVPDTAIGDVSVTWCKPLHVWLMTYELHPPQGGSLGVFFQYSKTPWGPWSPRQQLYARSEGAKFIHDPATVPDDGLGGPTIAPANPETTPGGMYAPYVVERWTKVEGSALDLYYLLSTWNPYTVVLMKSRLQVQ
jgi:hypothetical protein